MGGLPPRLLLHNRTQRCIWLPSARSSSGGSYASRLASSSTPAAEPALKKTIDRSRPTLYTVLLHTKNISLKQNGTRKLTPRWCGLFKILERIGAVAYKLELPASWKCHNVFHVSLLKEYTPGRVAPPPLVEINGEWEFKRQMLKPLRHPKLRLQQTPLKPQKQPLKPNRQPPQTENDGPQHLVG